MNKILLLVMLMILTNINVALAEIDSFQKAEPLVEHILKALDRGEYQEARRDFNETMLVEISAKEIDNFWKETKKDVGNFISYKKLSLKFEEGYSVFQYKVKYKKRDLIMTITFDKDEKIAGLLFEPSGRDLSRKEREEILQKVKSIVENIILNMDKEKYTEAAKDFNKDIKGALPISKFKETGKMIKDKIGKYKSHTPDTCRQEGEYIVIKYKGKYSKEPGDVIITISFDRDFKVAGLWFDSPKLKE